MITFDFETYYDSQFSLSKLTYEEYIRDPRFEVILVSLQVDDGEPVWFSGDYAATREWLRQFPWEQHAACAHNNAFDAAILIQHYGIVPKMLVCTQSMARAVYGLTHRLSLAKLGEQLLGLVKGTEVHNMMGRTRASLQPYEVERYAAYCVQDVRICRALFKHMRSMLPAEEMALIDWTLKVGAHPVLQLDRDLLTKVCSDEIRRKQELSDTLGFEINDLRNDDNLAYLLQLLGATPPQKTVNGKTKWAFTKQDVEFLEMADDPDPLVQTLVEARLAAKSTIVSSRAERLRGIAMRGPLPFPLLYYGAMNTGRWSGDQAINLQNLNRGSPLRDAIVAPPGYLLCVADLAQIELRVNMHTAGQDDVLNVLRQGKDADVYAHAAAPIFGYAVHKDTHPMERFVGKVTELSAGYGCGPERFRAMLRTAARREGKVLPDDSEAFCQRVIGAYRQSHAAVVKQWYNANDWIPRLIAGESGELMGCTVLGGVIWLPNGMSIRYPELQGNNGEYVYKRLYHGSESWPRIYGPKVVENVVQALSRIILSRALLRLSHHYYIAGSVHDELIMLVPETADTAAVKQHVLSEMTAPVDFLPGIPLGTSVDLGRRYGDCK